MNTIFYPLNDLKIFMTDLTDSSEVSESVILNDICSVVVCFKVVSLFFKQHLPQLLGIKTLK